MKIKKAPRRNTLSFGQSGRWNRARPWENMLKTRFQNAEAITLRGFRWALLLCYVWEYGEELKQWQRDKGLKCEKPEELFPNFAPAESEQG